VEVCGQGVEFRVLDEDDVLNMFGWDCFQECLDVGQYRPDLLRACNGLGGEIQNA
jgi:hypothetical protein